MTTAAFAHLADRATGGTAPVAAERRVARPDWLAEVPEEPIRGRVVRSDEAAVRVVDLPTVEDLTEADETECDDDPSEVAGGAAVTWAIGYRDGLESGRAEGHAEGWAAGRREGLERATAEAVARYERVLADLQRDADAHLAELRHLHDTVAAQATELAFSIAREVIGRELRLAEDPGADAVRRALAALPGWAMSGQSSSSPARHRRTAASGSWPSPKISASTRTASPTTRRTSGSTGA